MSTRPAPAHQADLPHLVALGSLIIIFLWVYGRFVFDLSFVMDDYIIATRGMYGPLGSTLLDSFTGALLWSGYRPLTEAIRVLMMHAFGLETMWPYFVICLGLHLLTTLLAYRLVRRVSGSTACAFFTGAIVLLLPSHNESIFWFSAIANILGLLFSLLALDFALTSLSRASIGWQLGAVSAFALAELSCEAALLLPILVFAAEYFLNGRPRGRRLRLYVLFAIATVGLLALRFAAQGSVAGPSRADYGFSLDPLRFIHGYMLIAFQMLALSNSPYPGAPLFEYTRNWLPFDGVEAWLAIFITAILCVVTFTIALRHEANSPDYKTSRPRHHTQFWFAWGLLWVVLLGAAFAGLSGRNPENRYTYFLSFGMAVSMTALFTWLYTASHRRHYAQIAVVGVASAILAFYAYTSVSDAHDWAAASQIVQSTQRSIIAAVPYLGEDQFIAQVNIPSMVGSAYAYATDATFQAAINLLYSTDRQVISRSENLRRHLRDNPDDAGKTFVFVYDETDGKTVPLVGAVLCTTPENCTPHKLARPDGTGMNSGLRLLDLYNTAEPQLGGLIFLGTFKPLNGRGCHLYQDYGVPLDPDALEIYPYDQRCADAVSAFQDLKH